METNAESKPKPPIKLGETMQTQEIEKTKPKKTTQEGSKTSKRGIFRKLSPEAHKLLEAIQQKANKKSFGKRIKASDIIAKSLILINEEHIHELQQASYSEKDRLQMAHDHYIKTVEKITLDQFIGKLIRGEMRTQIE